MSWRLEGVGTSPSSPLGSVLVVGAGWEQAAASGPCLSSSERHGRWCGAEPGLTADMARVWGTLVCRVVGGLVGIGGVSGL